MSGWHPQLPDGALLPNPQNPSNPSQAFDPTTPPNLASPLYFGNGCDVRLRPGVINSLISENLALIDRVGLQYNPASFFNTRSGVEYIVQRGYPRACILWDQGDPVYYYRGTLDPPLMGLHDGMVLTVLPTATNRGWVRVDVGNDYWVPVLRNDYQELRREDWPANVPQLIGYWHGAFYMLGLCKSQVPLVLVGAVYFWIRWDGNDETGDGTANTPDKAFRTIEGAWAAVGSRYAGSPSASIYLLLGIPGDYEGAMVGPFGASVFLVGDETNRQAYRILTKRYWPWSGGPALRSWAVTFNGVNQGYLNGVNCVINDSYAAPNAVFCLNAVKSSVAVWNCDFTLEASNDRGAMVAAEQAAAVHLRTFDQNGSRINFRGNNLTCEAIISAWQGSYIPGSPQGLPPCQLNYENVHTRWAGYSANDNCMISHLTTTTTVFNCTGIRYAVHGWSTIKAEGQPLPGDQPGQIGNGQFDG